MLATRSIAPAAAVSFGIGSFTEHDVSRKRAPTLTIRFFRLSCFFFPFAPRPTQAIEFFLPSLAHPRHKLFYKAWSSPALLSLARYCYVEIPRVCILDYASWQGHDASRPGCRTCIRYS